ncbi:MAG: SRPBCC family protein [Candidatus Azobacteroides sp.]|nr:SRPBCC family protein [Candidatus Azobacteroides sp.]
MTEFISEIKTIPYNETDVFDMLSDLSNLERMKDKIPQEKISDFTFDKDSCSFSVSPIGKIKFSIIEREPNKTIKFKAEESPIDVTLWVQLKQTDENDTKMKLTIKAELNPFIKPMVSKPIQEGINKVADVLAAIPYK